MCEGLTLGESDRGHLGVDFVENALIPDLGLGDQADLGAQAGNSSSGPRHGQLYHVAADCSRPDGVGPVMRLAATAAGGRGLLDDGRDIGGGPLEGPHITHGSTTACTSALRHHFEPGLAEDLEDLS